MLQRLSVYAPSWVRFLYNKSQCWLRAGNHCGCVKKFSHRRYEAFFGYGFCRHDRIRIKKIERRFDVHIIIVDEPYELGRVVIVQVFIQIVYISVMLDVNYRVFDSLVETLPIFAFLIKRGPTGPHRTETRCGVPFARTYIFHTG